MLVLLIAMAVAITAGGAGELFSPFHHCRFGGADAELCEGVEEEEEEEEDNDIIFERDDGVDTDTYDGVDDDLTCVGTGFAAVRGGAGAGRAWGVAKIALFSDDTDDADADVEEEEEEEEGGGAGVGDDKSAIDCGGPACAVVTLAVFTEGTEEGCVWPFSVP